MIIGNRAGTGIAADDRKGARVRSWEVGKLRGWEGLRVGGRRAEGMEQSTKRRGQRAWSRGIRLSALGVGQRTGGIGLSDED